MFVRPDSVIHGAFAHGVGGELGAEILQRGQNLIVVRVGQGRGGFGNFGTKGASHFNEADFRNVICDAIKSIAAVVTDEGERLTEFDTPTCLGSRRELQEPTSTRPSLTRCFSICPRWHGRYSGR
jgi:hypothetical protein